MSYKNLPSSGERVQCARTRACGWKGTKADCAWEPNPNGRIGGKIAVCPECGHSEFLCMELLSDTLKRILAALKIASAGGPATADAVRKEYRIYSTTPFVASRLKLLMEWGYVEKVPVNEPRVRTRWKLAPEVSGS